MTHFQMQSSKCLHDAMMRRGGDKCEKEMGRKLKHYCQLKALSQTVLAQISM